MRRTCLYQWLQCPLGLGFHGPVRPRGQRQLYGTLRQGGTCHLARRHRTYPWRYKRHERSDCHPGQQRLVRPRARFIRLWRFMRTRPYQCRFNEFRSNHYPYTTRFLRFCLRRRFWNFHPLLQYFRPRDQPWPFYHVVLLQRRLYRHGVLVRWIGFSWFSNLPLGVNLGDTYRFRAGSRCHLSCDI